MPYSSLYINTNRNNNNNNNNPLKKSTKERKKNASLSEKKYTKKIKSLGC